MEYFHIRFWFYDDDDRQGWGSCIFNLSEEDLVNLYLKPLKNNSVLSINGARIDKSWITRINILKSKPMLSNNYTNSSWQDQSKAFDTVSEIGETVSDKYLLKFEILSESQDSEELQVEPKSPAIAQNSPKTNKIFIVHGHDKMFRRNVSNLLKAHGLVPVILQDQSNKGRFVYGKFEDEAKDCSFAIALMSPDDEINDRKEDEGKFRARQNVIFELGYFCGKLGIEKTAVILHDEQKEMEMPSDIKGLVYISTKNPDWEASLIQELKDAGCPVTS